MTAPHAASDDRTREIAEALTSVQERIAAATEGAGLAQPPTLVVVTKNFPASDVVRVADLGVRDVGENKAQELEAKFTDLVDLGVRSGLTVHFIGQLQTNKAGVVAAHADVVHAVDRAKLASALDRRRAMTGLGRLRVLLQVSLDGDPRRGGVLPDQVGELADDVAGLAHLEVAGVMAVAPLGEDPDVAFERLREVSQSLQCDHPGATWISAGMSGDLEAAIRHGATHLRVGTAILGTRPSLR